MIDESPDFTGAITVPSADGATALPNTTPKLAGRAPAAYPLPPYKTLDYDHVFLSRLFVQTTLPHRKPKTLVFERSNGNLTVALWAPRQTGLPYGTVPRHILIWICTQVCALKTRTFEFPASFTSFLRTIGVSTGHASNARRQLEALFSLAIDVRYTASTPEEAALAKGDALLEARKGFLISDEYQLWWNSRAKEARFVVCLSERFYDYAQTSQIPLDWNIVRQLQGSLDLDLYAWLVSRTQRTVRRQQPELVSWDRLRFQFGSDYASPHEFARKFRQALTRVLAFYPYARLKATRDGLQVLPFNALPLANRLVRELPTPIAHRASISE